MYLSGLNPIPDTSSRQTIQVEIMLMFSNVPSTVQEQNAYLDTLKKEIRTLLNLSLEWSITIYVVGDGRRYSPTRNLVVRIVFARLFAGPGDLSKLQSDLYSPVLLDQLHALNFEASKANIHFTSRKSTMRSTSGEKFHSSIEFSNSFSIMEWPWALLY